jgi:[acyl-carrier-protein] S-malonyltransferase
MFDTASTAIGTDMKALLWDEEERLGQSLYTQPAILLVSAIAHKLFENEMGIKPVFALGHSLGEFSALCGVGALTLENAVYTVHNRGLWMQEACEGKDAGMMVVLGLSDEATGQIVDGAREGGKEVWAANFNSDGQIVLAGKRGDLDSLTDALKGAGAKRAMLLNMSVASHCPMLQPAALKLAALLEERLSDTFLAPVISNVTAAPYSSKAEALDLLPKQLTMPVMYKHSVAALENDVDLLIEFGHGSVLKGINKKVTEVPTISVSDMATLEAAFDALKD